jgi:hypothetical protein
MFEDVKVLKVVVLRAREHLHLARHELGCRDGPSPLMPSTSSFMRSPITSSTSCGRWRCRKAGAPWPLTSLREKLIKIGAKVVSHGRYVTFQMAEVAVPRQMFAEILSLIGRLRAPPAPA